MGFLSNALKNVTAEDVNKATSNRFVGLNAGGYLAKITDAKLTEITGGANKGTPQIEVTVRPFENWDGDAVAGSDIKSFVALSGQWASGKQNFTLLQFLKSIDEWDEEEEEFTFDFEDEDDLFDQLVDREVSIYVDYRRVQPTERYPDPRIFNEISRWLAPGADLYAGRQTFQEAQDAWAEEAGGPDPDAVAKPKAKAKSKSKSTSTKFKLPGAND